MVQTHEFDSHVMNRRTNGQLYRILGQDIYNGGCSEKIVAK